MSVSTPSFGRRARRRTVFIAAGIVAALIVVLGIVSTFYTEILWFRETGYGSVFWTSIWTRLGLGAVFGVTFALLMLVNLWIVRKITNPARLFSVPDQILERYRTTLQPYTKWVVIGAAVVFGLFAGSGATARWKDWLLFRHAQSFGTVDQVFKKDIGFYIFKLPFQQFVFTWLFSSLIVITIIVGIAHYFMGGIRPQARGERVAPEVRAHLSVLLGMIVLLKAWGYRLDQFNLLYSGRGTVTGASYTDIHASLPAMTLLIYVSIICAVLFLINARFKNWILPLGGIGLLVLMSIVAGGIYPAAIQKLRVTPNERLREVEFIERNIKATRAAYGLDGVELRSFAADDSLTAKQVGSNRQTVENIRLWDPHVLVNTYVNLQRIKQYYEFGDVDVDRYTFGSGRRQVMLSARELDTNGLTADAKTWLNTHLVYTHGYGVVASRVDRVTGEGRPSFVVSDIPMKVADNGPKVTEPRIYYGENEQNPFVVVNSQQKELDFPQGDGFAETKYDGAGGVKLSSVFTRAAFAWRFRDVNLLISGAIKPESKILFRRNIAERAKTVAPFLRFDGDPYITVVDGRLKWIIDGYTTTNMYPYSQRANFGDVSGGSVSGSGNYIRNSAKFVIDAKDGTITGYVWDENDPILKAWLSVFPNIMKPRSSIPASLLAHVRYPEGLFKVQSDRYANYHITSANNFYSKEDAWLVAGDPTFGLNNGSANIGSSPAVDPYYVLTKLPGEKDLDFVLVRPFTPTGNRPNLTSYLVAHCDPENYGRIVEYAFPKSGSTFGPEQIEARINQDPDVSRQVTLWNQQNSHVIYGNLLIVPIDKSLLYVQPLYLQGQGSQLPELKRVVAVVGENVSMASTLDGALAQIFGAQAPGQLVITPSETVASLLAEALAHDRAAQAALQRGDLATFAREYAKERAAVAKAAEKSGAKPSPATSPTP